MNPKDSKNSELAEDTPEAKVAVEDSAVASALGENQEEQAKFIQEYLNRFSPNNMCNLDLEKCLVLGSKTNLTRKNSLYRQTLIEWKESYRQTSKPGKKLFLRKVLLDLVKKGCIFYKTTKGEEHDYVLPVLDPVRLEDRMARDFIALNRETIDTKKRPVVENADAVAEDAGELATIMDIMDIMDDVDDTKKDSIDVDDAKKDSNDADAAKKDSYDADDSKKDSNYTDSKKDSTDTDAMKDSSADTDAKKDSTKTGEEEADPLDYMAPPPLALDRTLHSWSKRQLPIHEDYPVEEEKVKNGTVNQKDGQEEKKLTPTKEPMELLPRPQVDFTTAVYGSSEWFQMGTPAVAAPMMGLHPVLAGGGQKRFGASIHSRKTAADSKSPKKRGQSSKQEEPEDTAPFPPHLLMMESIGSLPPGFSPPPSPGNKRIRCWVTNKNEKAVNGNKNGTTIGDGMVQDSETKDSAPPPVAAEKAGTSLPEKNQRDTEMADKKGGDDAKMPHKEDNNINHESDDDEVIIIEELCKKGRASVTPEKTKSSSKVLVPPKAVVAPFDKDISKEVKPVGAKRKMANTVRTRRQSVAESGAVAPGPSSLNATSGGRKKKKTGHSSPSNNKKATSSIISTVSSQATVRRSNRRGNPSNGNSRHLELGEFPCTTAEMGDQQFADTMRQMLHRLRHVENRMAVMETQNRRFRQRLADLEDEEDRRAQETVHQARAFATSVFVRTGQEGIEDIHSSEEDYEVDENGYGR